MKVRFVLLAEGPSDEPLVPHLENLCLRAGATVVSVYWLDFRRVGDPPGRKLGDQLAWLMRNTSFNLLFIHRDADDADDSQARSTIENGIRESSVATPHVPVVPIQELEAWLLLDEPMLRSVAGNPRGKQPLDLPKSKLVERRARPKELLKAALKAAEKPGRRSQPFGHARRLLLERLDLDGPINQLEAWKKLLADIDTAITRLRSPVSTDS
jgi:hypothetical protein